MDESNTARLERQGSGRLAESSGRNADLLEHESQRSQLPTELTASTTPPSAFVSPFLRESRAPSRKPTMQSQKEGARLKGSRGSSEVPRGLSGTARPKVSTSGRLEKSVSTLRIPRQNQELSSTGSKGLASKAPPQLHKVSFKPDKGKERGKQSGAMKRTLSLDELQPQPGPQRSSSGNLGLHPSAPKRLLQRLTFGPPAAKGTLKLPLLAPSEKKILAAVGQRDWIKVDNRGTASVLKRDKHAVTHELGIQIRDLRLLDPLMTSSYPSCLLCRDKALVVNLEYIKCIITTSYVLILDAEKQAVEGFSTRLQKRIREGFERTDEVPDTTVLGLVRPSMGGPPFELKALEVALDEVCRHLEDLGSELEISVRPMVGKSTAGKVTSDYLERLRRVKTTLVRLKTRVETLKEVLEKYLEDEDDMKGVHLSGRLREQKAAALRRLARRSLREAGAPAPDQQDPAAGLAAEQPPWDLEGERVTSEVEMLLEAYYMNLDSTWNKLADISESLDDAEELMDLEMDTYRNNIIRMKVFFGGLHLLAGTLWMIANIFGMNLGLLEDDLLGTTHPKFIKVTAISFGGALFLMLLFTYYLHQRRLAITTITI